MKFISYLRSTEDDCRHIIVADSLDGIGKGELAGYLMHALWMLIGSFVLLQMCWWGINYLPSAQGSSVHTYSISE